MRLKVVAVVAALLQQAQAGLFDSDDRVTALGRKSKYRYRSKSRSKSKSKKKYKCRKYCKKARKYKRKYEKYCRKCRRYGGSCGCCEEERDCPRRRRYCSRSRSGSRGRSRSGSRDRRRPWRWLTEENPSAQESLAEKMQEASEFKGEKPRPKSREMGEAQQGRPSRFLG